MDYYQKLTERFKQIYRLEHAITYLSWDQMVMMPGNGNDARAASMAELASIRHNYLTAPEVSDWLDEVDNLDDVETRQMRREMRRDWRNAVCLPADLVKAKVVAGARCEHAWRQQRPDNNWTGFLDNFREIVALSREESRKRQEDASVSFDTPYEALLDLHCAGDSQALVDSVFESLRDKLPSLLEKAADKSAARSTLTGDYPVADQHALNQELVRCLGFDFDSGRLDQSVHPFSTGTAGDLRITTRYRTSEFLDALNATAHETGHASYQGGLPPDLEGLPLGNYRNMCIHESQSLLFEKQIFLSKAYTRFFAPKVHELLPASRAYDAGSLWQANTRVCPGLIRVEADEVSYPLHVLLRYEIERDLINGHVEAEHIPELWNNKMQDYLGLSTDGNFTDGCMQDIHWTDGGFGYFPSYTMGAVNAAQIFNTIKQSHANWQKDLESGEIGFIRRWLSENIWLQGCSFESQELMTFATGEGSNPEYYLDHLTARYIDEAY